MSYAGTYGASETCPHDTYWRSCQYCSLIGPNPTPEQIERRKVEQAERKRAYLAHPADVETIEIVGRMIEVFDAVCPNVGCGWSRNGLSKDEMDRALARHLDSARDVANKWQNVQPEDVWVDPENQTC